jgi:NADH dehydrogenase [ubiquinone] 1 alpha subcomplex assembly factor 5
MASPPELFDLNLRSLRRDRAARQGPALFLYNRAYNDIVERMADVKYRFHSALLLGAPDPEWADCVAEMTTNVVVVDPGAEFARQSDGIKANEEELDLEPGTFDLIVAIGTLDTVNDLPGALLRLRFLLKPDGLLIGAIAGGQSLPRLRSAMRAADAVSGAASPHVHPRIEPAALAQLLGAAGFAMPVVDVDRVNVAYRGLRKLVADLRAMGGTNLLTARSRRPLARKALNAAEDDFAAAGQDGRTVETFEILHFAAWSPAERP